MFKEEGDFLAHFATFGSLEPLEGGGEYTGGIYGWKHGPGGIFTATIYCSEHGGTVLDISDAMAAVTHELGWWTVVDCDQ